ncbi:hypothetical protein [Desulfoluna butyratoxydans]|uniref:hypothetical protein n=1 Tax=Desulfoluna butyratoxydans TaxID=231438 RepID=UPI0015D1B92B|nr:hypothetical protein [Desulfoluna butyratoxydans]
MNCPHCSSKVNLRDKTINTKELPRRCPKCSEPVTLYLDTPSFLKFAAPIFIIGSIMRSLFFPSNTVVFAIALGLGLLAGYMNGYQLKPYEETNINS